MNVRLRGKSNSAAVDGVKRPTRLQSDDQRDRRRKITDYAAFTRFSQALSQCLSYLRRLLSLLFIGMRQRPKGAHSRGSNTSGETGKRWLKETPTAADSRS